MTPEKTRRKIAQLRALAASTTFPAEAQSARAKANELERALAPDDVLTVEKLEALIAQAKQAMNGLTGMNHMADAFSYQMASNPYFRDTAEEVAARQRHNEEVLRQVMRERWQRMFDEAMGRKPRDA